MRATAGARRQPPRRREHRDLDPVRRRKAIERARLLSGLGDRACAAHPLLLLPLGRAYVALSPDGPRCAGRLLRELGTHRPRERALARDGVVVGASRSDRGTVRNPWNTVLNQYRAHWRALAGELGLTPASRIDRPRDTDPDDDPFDTD